MLFDSDGEGRIPLLLLGLFLTYADDGGTADGHSPEAASERAASPCLSMPTVVTSLLQKSHECP